ncbi:MAG TPA: nuclear transport factor 2 family protein [Actinobacteria bacterium]|nr:nuclear transport factor 2 family protein [Actinomycetota bacterium]
MVSLAMLRGYASRATLCENRDMEHPGIRRIKEGYRCFSEGDCDGFVREFADDAVWHVRGDTPLAGDKVGREEILEFLRSLAQDTHGSFMIEVHDVLANDLHTVVLAHTTVNRDEGTYTADEVHVFCTKEGRITEAWGFTSDPGGRGKFWF